MWAISICRREKYFARIRIKINLVGSDGSIEKKGKLNQLEAPLMLFPKTRREIKKAAAIPKTALISRLFLKNANQ